MLLHGLLLVFSLITVAPLMIVFSMTIPTTPADDAANSEAILLLEAPSTQRRRPRALQEALKDAPHYTHQLLWRS